MTVRTLGSARADISNVVLERLPPLDSAVAAVQARSETSDRTDREHEHQCFASHLSTSPFFSGRVRSRGRKAQTR
jgi:hypothetical protein